MNVSICQKIDLQANPRESGVISGKTGENDLKDLIGSPIKLANMRLVARVSMNRRGEMNVSISGSGKLFSSATDYSSAYDLLVTACCLLEALGDTRGKSNSSTLRTGMASHSASGGSKSPTDSGVIRGR